MIDSSQKTQRGRFLSSFLINEATALYDGAAYPEMLAILGRATKSVRLSFFLFGGPDADAMIDVLADLLKRGVSVRIILDRSLGLEGLLPGIIWECRRAYSRLRKLGIEICLSDARHLPCGPQTRQLWHHKYIVVDDREALVGGMNVGSLFRRYHDLMIHLEGPTAAQLGRQFDFDWRCALGAQSPLSADQSPISDDLISLKEDSTETHARLLGTGVGRRTTEQALHRNISRSKKSISVAVCEMGYTGLLDELISSQARGVRVRVLLCPLQLSPLLPKGILNAGAIDALREKGVPVHLYRLGNDFMRMHQKVAIFDAERAVTGSTNWTRGGFGWIGETDVELRGGDVVAQLAAGFDADWERSDPAPLPTFGARRLHGLYEKLTQ